MRAAAKNLGVNHATVLRRIAQLEERLGALMFEKLPAGYRLTAAVEEVLELAKQMEASSLRLETRVLVVRERARAPTGDAGATPRDTPAHAGPRRFRASASVHPDGNPVIRRAWKSTNREADVAIRVVYDRKTLPLNLHGLKGPEVFGGVYSSAIDWLHGARARLIPSGGSS